MKLYLVDKLKHQLNEYLQKEIHAFSNIEFTFNSCHEIVHCSRGRIVAIFLRLVVLHNECMSQPKVANGAHA